MLLFQTIVFEMSNLHDQRFIAIIDLEDQILALKTEKGDIKERLRSLKAERDKIQKFSDFCPDIDDNDGGRILNQDDRIRIVNDIASDMSEKDYIKYTQNLESLFWHHSNIKFIYKESGLTCPQWFIDKY